MKSLTFRELDLIIEVAESFIGFFVQEAIISNDMLVLFLRLGSKEAFLIADVGSQKPVFLATQQPLPPFKKQTKPLILFLRKHLVGKRFIGISRKINFGRLVDLHFESSEGLLELELHLFPQSRNIIAKVKDSQLSLNKSKDLLPITNSMIDENPRSPEQIYSEWVGFRKISKSQVAQDPLVQFEKIKTKKKEGLNALREKWQDLTDPTLENVGDWLKEHQTLEVPLEYTKYIDHRKSLRANIADIFEKVKTYRLKAQSVQDRLELLERELAHLSVESTTQLKLKKKPPASPLQNAKGRTKNFENGISAYIGKSAADNLNILRKAKSWYWWVHPKDLPGSHAIIAIDKGAQLNSNILRQVALWTLEQTLSPKQWKDWQGVKCQFIYTECRFVTPIKGDKLGRVNYKNEKTLTLVVSS